MRLRQRRADAGIDVPPQAQQRRWIGRRARLDHRDLCIVERPRPRVRIPEKGVCGARVRRYEASADRHPRVGQRQGAGHEDLQSTRACLRLLILPESNRLDLQRAPRSRCVVYDGCNGRQRRTGGRLQQGWLRGDVVAAARQTKGQRGHDRTQQQRTAAGQGRGRSNDRQPNDHPDRQGPQPGRQRKAEQDRSGQPGGHGLTGTCERSWSNTRAGMPRSMSVCASVIGPNRRRWVAIRSAYKGPMPGT